MGHNIGQSGCVLTVGDDGLPMWKELACEEQPSLSLEEMEKAWGEAMQSLSLEKPVTARVLSSR